MNAPTGLVWNLVAYRFKGGETVCSLTLNCRVIQRTGTRHGSTARILLWLVKTRCPGFRALRLESTHPLPDKLTAIEQLPLTPKIKKIKALLGNGLDGVDLVRV